MRLAIEPFALLLYRRHRAGESVAELAAAFGIPEDRVSMRLRVAAAHAERLDVEQSLQALHEQLTAR